MSEERWNKILASQQPSHGSFHCPMCRKKMKGKRSKSLSPEPSSSRESKIPKLSDDYLDNGNDDDEDSNRRNSLLDFSDDVLLNIMKYLPPQDLLSLGLCCHRLNQVFRDKSLWKKADFRTQLMKMNNIRIYYNYLHQQTTSIAINGKYKECNRDLEELKSHFLTRISKCNLKELVVEEYSIISNDIKITDFPSTLEKLSLKGTRVCHLITNKSYFFKMDLHMTNLTTLIVSNCQWLTGHSLLVISKIPKLKELRMDSCKHLGESVAYASLATRFGFKTLEILDLRRTGFGDSEIKCFSCTSTLTHIYLEYSPDFAESLENDNEDDGDNNVNVNVNQVPLYEDNIIAQYAVDENHFIQDNLSHQRISDRSICALGSYVCDRRVLDDFARDAILIEEDVRVYNNPNLKVVVVRNYPRVTNKTLIHLAANVNYLEYLDVTGTSVTKDGIQTFKSQKPNVKLVSSYQSI